MSGSAWQECERCGRRCRHYGGDRCAQCKREDKARTAERQRAQAARGRVGDVARAAAVLASVDALARQVREAAGVGRRS